MKQNPTVNDALLIREMKEVLVELIKGIVDTPDEVKISETVVGKLVAFKIYVNKLDVRKIVGSKGRRIRSLVTLFSEMAKQLDREVHLGIDEEPFTGAVAQAKGFALGHFSAKKWSTVKDLLARVLEPFSEDDVQINFTEFGPSTTIIQIVVSERDYQMIYGTDATFDYGTDGHLFGAIKNIFDGIGKRNGRFVRMVMTKR